MISTKPNVPGTIHQISTSALAATVGTDPDGAIAKIGIVPNPYRGSSWYETTNVEDEVRFTNLPTQATIRVFTIDGTLVRTLFKNSPNPSLPWDMANDSGLRLASGIYLIHVELADGREKVLKFAMVRDKVQLSAF
jgi:hypothetical protein